MCVRARACTCVYMRVLCSCGSSCVIYGCVRERVTMCVCVYGGGNILNVFDFLPDSAHRWLSGSARGLNSLSECGKSCVSQLGDWCSYLFHIHVPNAKISLPHLQCRVPCAEYCCNGKITRCSSMFFFSSFRVAFNVASGSDCATANVFLMDCAL